LDNDDYIFYLESSLFDDSLSLNSSMTHRHVVLLNLTGTSEEKKDYTIAYQKA